MSTTNLRGPQGALKLPRTSLGLINYAKAVHDALQGNPNFPSPTPTLAVFAADIGQLENAETRAATKAKGSARQRDLMRKKVIDDLSQLRAYVQTIVDAQPSAAAGAAVIESAFMSVKKPSKRDKPELSAQNTGTSGTVALTTKAVASAGAYYWQYSLDQKTWNSAAETRRASTVIAGLTPMQVYSFRSRALTRAGAQGYTQVVSLLVV